MNDIIKAIEVFKNGGVVIFPTDTVFGIGCRIDRKDSIERIFKIKNREGNVPLPILVSDFEMAQKYLEFLEQKIIDSLIKKYWPGALTIVAKCKTEKVLDIVRSGKDSVAIRMPNNKTLLEIIKEINIPIIGTSANFHGKPSVFKFEDLDKDLISKVDFVLDGNCGGESASTIIDVTQTPWKILRQGIIKI